MSRLAHPFYDMSYVSAPLSVLIERISELFFEEPATVCVDYPVNIVSCEWIQGQASTSQHTSAYYCLWNQKTYRNPLPHCHHLPTSLLHTSPSPLTRLPLLCTVIVCTVTVPTQERLIATATQAQTTHNHYRWKILSSCPVNTNLATSPLARPPHLFLHPPLPTPPPLPPPALSLTAPLSPNPPYATSQAYQRTFCAPSVPVFFTTQCLYTVDTASASSAWPPCGRTAENRHRQ